MANESLPQGRPIGRPRRRAGILGRMAEQEQRGGYRNPNLFQPTCTPERVNWLDERDKKALRKTPVVTTFRLLPEFGEDGIPYPAREVSQSGQIEFSGWIDSHLTMKLPGRKDHGGSAYLLADSNVPGFNKFDDPGMILLSAITQAGKADEAEGSWLFLTSKDNQQGRLDWPSWNFFAYALVHGRGEKEWYDIPKGLRPEDEKPIVFHMNTQVGKGITRIVNQPVAGQESVLLYGVPDDESIDAYFECPDPVALAGGVLFRAFMLDGRDPRLDEQKPRADGKKVPAFWNRPATEGEKVTSIGYEVYATSRARLPRGRDEKDLIVKAPIDEKHWEMLARKHDRPVADHLVFVDDETKIRLLVEHVRKQDGSYHSSLFRYAFRDNQALEPIVLDALSSVEKRVATFDPGSRDDRRAVRGGERPSASAPSQGRGRPVDDEPEDDDLEDEADDEAGEATPVVDPRIVSRTAARRPAPTPDEDEDDEAPEDEDLEEPEDDEDVVDEDEDEDNGDDEEDNGDDDHIVAAAIVPPAVARPVSRTSGLALAPTASDEPPAPVRTPSPPAAPRTAKEKMADLKKTSMSKRTN